MVLALERADCQKWWLCVSRPLEEVKGRYAPYRRGRDLEMGQKCFH